MTGLVAFLRARLDEDEQAARAALQWAGTQWSTKIHVNRETGQEVMLNDFNGRRPIAELTKHADQTGDARLDVARHIERNDPARVLADIAAKRRVVELAEAIGNVEIVEALALPYSDHPLYGLEWQ